MACLYHGAPEPLYSWPHLLLNGEGVGPINNLCVHSHCPGQFQDQQTIAGDLATLIRQQLREWFGSQVEDWQPMRAYHIRFAQPVQVPPFPNLLSRQEHVHDGVFVCGDFCATKTIDGALFFGRRAAKDIRKWLEA